MAAVWRASKVPYVADHVGYYVYEGDDGCVHPQRAEYAYWHLQGLAGCLLREHLRLRLGLSSDLHTLRSQLFPGPQEGVTP